VDKPGEEQYVGDSDIKEEVGVLGPQFQGVDESKRKSMLSDPEVLQDFEFDTTHVYTFDYYQQYFRARHFALDLGVKLLDLCYYMGRQPLLLTMAKTMDTDEYLWKFELWHEKCLVQAPQ